MPAAVLAKERDTLEGQAAEQNAKAPEHVRGKIVEGRLGKWYGEVALLDQECMVELGDEDPAAADAPKKSKKDKTVGAAVARQAAALGIDGGLEVAGYVRYACGAD